MKKLVILLFVFGIGLCYGDDFLPECQLRCLVW
jgi:hypothetical protein